MISFDQAKELAEQRGDEWQLGAVPTDVALVPYSSRMSYVPAGVLQRNDIMDSNGCASRGPNNILETKLTWLHHNGMHPEIQRWGIEKGYVIVENGRHVWKLNDAYVEIGSGTTPTGNSLKAPVDYIRRYGAIPAHLLPLEDGMTWEQYMNPARVTQEMRDLGKEFLKRLPLAYEQVQLSQFNHARAEDLLDVAGAAWPPPVDGTYPANDAPFNHAFATANNEIDALDNYSPFFKRLAPDYNFFQWGYSISITAQIPFPTEDPRIPLYQKLIELLNQYIALLAKRVGLWKN